MHLSRRYPCLLALAFVVSMVACQSQPRPDEEPVTDEDLAPEPAPGSHVVPVALSNYHIDMPEEIPAGPTIFRIEHRGEDVLHSFAIRSDEVNTELQNRLRPGESVTFEVDLPPGRYFIFCPVDNHQGFGMVHELTAVEDKAP